MTETNSRGELSQNILKTIVSTATTNNCTRVDFVADLYPAVSIKNAERVRPTIRDKYSDSPQSGQQLQKENETVQKVSVIEWKQGKSNWISLRTLEDCQPMFSSESWGVLRTHIVWSISSLLLSQWLLHSDHEEADTKILLHAAHALQSCSAITIQSDDTDVLVLCVGMKTSLKGKTVPMRHWM